MKIDASLFQQLADEFGTPTYVYSEEAIKEQLRKLSEAFRESSILYAIKANHNPHIVSLLRNMGCGADASSLFEVELALRCGVPAERISYTASFPSRYELNAVQRLGAKLNLDNLYQLEQLESLPEYLSFRLNPGIGRFSGEESKFGLSEAEIRKGSEVAKKRGVKRFGLHMMTGSNVLDSNYFYLIAEAMAQCAARLPCEFAELNTGGSFGVPYQTGEEELAIKEVGRQVQRIFESTLTYKPKHVIEPGRYLLAPCGLLLTRVTAVKQAQRRFVGVDAGMNTLLRPALYGAAHRILYLNDLTAPCDASADIVGPICTTTDRFAKDYPLPGAVKEGDLLAILTCGAYGYVLSSQFNSRPRAAEVLLTDAGPKLIRPRETFAELFGACL